MSQQFVFWRAERALDSAAVYSSLLEDGVTVDGLEPLDPGLAERAIITAFPTWTVELARADGGNQTMLAGPGERGAIDVGYLPQAVVATCYGMDPEEWNVVIRAFTDLGMPLYDPQIGHRFD
ncbi:hypothetical protein ACRQ4C_04585 [Curtobacterium sp. SP.BCp]|uniref:hypothetical protein n=1 Tax=Curtobacterium sp. SP.BCp TaxID=3435230 RepID=UPI003F73F8AC